VSGSSLGSATVPTFDVVEAGAFGAATEHRQHLRLDVDAVDDALGADAGRDAERVVAVAAAEVADRHAFFEAEVVEEERDVLLVFARLAEQPVGAAPVHRLRDLAPHVGGGGRRELGLRFLLRLLDRPGLGRVLGRRNVRLLLRDRVRGLLDGLPGFPRRAAEEKQEHAPAERGGQRGQERGHARIIARRAPEWGRTLAPPQQAQGTALHFGQPAAYFLRPISSRSRPCSDASVASHA
jgi:hypothetical protein